MGAHMKVSPAEMRRFMELYDTYGTYAAVAREMHRSPQTVSKYIRMAIAAGFTLTKEEESSNSSIKLGGNNSITITFG